jgi:predicted transport protein
MNKTFATLLKKVDKTRYFRSVQAELLRLDNYRRFPSDAETMQCLSRRDIYNSPRCAYLLERLENHFRPKEPIRATDYTIEHIMPQNLSADWRAMLGPNCETIHETYLHTLGNLTLTGYNSELSDRAFLEKKNLKEGGFKTSPVKLNQYPAQQQVWTEQQIVDRCEILGREICSVWPFPDRSVVSEFTETAEGETKVYDLGHYSILKGAVLDLYKDFESAVLALNPDVRREFKKLYVAFKYETNFVDVIPQASGLVLSINLPPDKLEDPKGWCRDMTGLGRWGNGDLELRLVERHQFEYALSVVQQALNEQLRDDIR